MKNGFLKLNAVMFGCKWAPTCYSIGVVLCHYVQFLMNLILSGENTQLKYSLHIILKNC